MREEKKFMNLAIAEAHKAKSEGNLPCGAIVVRKNKVVGSGKAEDKTTGDVTHHAEVLAIRAACKNLGTNDLSDCTIYSTVEPCLMCASTIFQAGIPKVVIGASRYDLREFLRPRTIRIHDLAQDLRYIVEIKTGILKEVVCNLFKE